MEFRSRNLEFGIIMETKKKIQSFTDLEVWREAHILVLLIYKITKSFPKEELFGLTSQLRRSVVSVTSNIAEGFSRFSYKEKVQFYTTALGSLTEIENQLLIARDVRYLDKNNFEKLFQQAITVQKLLNAFIKKSKSF
jgi:four helix bundle protein